MSDDMNETTQSLRLDLSVTPTVLLVDDDPLVLARLRELVAADGYVVHTAQNGVEALKSLDSLSASIVVSDLNMPGMSGLELCRRIRERTYPGYVYVVLLTIRADEEDVLAGLDAGADDYLSKRSSAAMFTARLRTAKRILALEHSLKDALAKKRRLAMSDSLTGAYNRRYFTKHLSRELERIQRFGGDLSLLLLDIDNFKRINDTYGHSAGGGDEFGLEELANPDSATVQAVLECADTHLYASKARGRNRITSANWADPTARKSAHPRPPYASKSALSSVR
jgi:PleD family two-component response regulator